MFDVHTGRYYESYPASQCHTSSNIYPGDKMDNPMFGGGGFFNDGSLMTGHECREACDDASNVDNHGRPCVAYEHSSQNPNDKAKCALAWACESVESWNGGSAYKKIGISCYISFLFDITKLQRLLIIITINNVVIIFLRNLHERNSKLEQRESLKL